MRVLVTERSVGCGCVSDGAPVESGCPDGADADAQLPSDMLVTWAPVAPPKQVGHTPTQPPARAAPLTPATELSFSLRHEQSDQLHAARLAAARAGTQRPLASATAAERAGDGAGQAAGWHGGGVGDRALHVAARRGDVEMVAMLLRRGADAAARNARGKTALDDVRRWAA